jgi:hypothetical protein
MDYEIWNEKRYFYTLSTDEKIIDLWQRGYSIPYIADRLKIECRKAALLLGFLKLST